MCWTLSVLQCFYESGLREWASKVFKEVFKVKEGMENEEKQQFTERKNEKGRGIVFEERIGLEKSTL